MGLLAECADIIEKTQPLGEYAVAPCVFDERPLPSAFRKLAEGERDLNESAIPQLTVAVANIPCWEAWVGHEAEPDDGGESSIVPLNRAADVARHCLVVI